MVSAIEYLQAGRSPNQINVTSETLRIIFRTMLSIFTSEPSSVMASRDTPVSVCDMTSMPTIALGRAL